jgi:hypothetical protein
MFIVLLERSEENEDIIQVGKTEVESQQIIVNEPRSFVYRRDGWESGCTPSPDRSLRRSNNQTAGGSNHVCDGRNSGREWFRCSVLL